MLRTRSANAPNRCCFARVGSASSNWPTSASKCATSRLSDSADAVVSQYSMQLGVSSYAFGWAVGVPGHPPPRPFNEHDLLEFARAFELSVIQFGDHMP